jgi:CO dehydrogenase nickel-insertion accessory protein CooC1
MKIAIAGKGGSGKTTIAGIITRLLAERGQNVWAIDADSNPNFGVTLGLGTDAMKQSKAMPSSILKEVKGADGKATMQLAMPARKVAEDFGTRVSDRVTLLGMHTIEHAGAGCACGDHIFQRPRNWHRRWRQVHAAIFVTTSKACDRKRNKSDEDGGQNSFHRVPHASEPTFAA